MKDYLINIFYSEEDGGYIANIPDLRGCSAFGNTAAEALSEVERAKDLWLEAARTEGLPALLPNYKKRLTAYLDILGFSDMTRTKQQAEAEAIIEKLDTQLRYRPKVFSGWPSAGFSVKLISDSICVSCWPDRVSMMVYLLARLQLDLSVEGIFVRGGVAFGRHFENDVVLFSEGLVDAITLEKKASCPLVLLADDIAIQMSDGPNDIDTQYYVAGFYYVSTTPAGRRFVDYLEAAWSPAWEKYLAHHKLAVLQNCREHVTDCAIVNKCRWLVDYHNWKFDQFWERQQRIEKIEDQPRKGYVELRDEARFDLEKDLPSFGSLDVA